MFSESKTKSWKALDTGIRSPELMFPGKRMELLLVLEKGRAWEKAVFLKDSLVIDV